VVLASEAKLSRIREQLRRGEYTIDPDAVADAVLERLRLRAIAAHVIVRGARPNQPVLAQNECSYPTSGSPSESAPENETPLPSTARPTHVTPASRRPLALASIVLRAAGGAQMQSS